jgi:hypothetical protein
MDYPTDKTDPTTAQTILTGAVDQLLEQLHYHEDQAAKIRASLTEARRKLASTGKRAGAKARSGRKRRAVAEQLPAEAVQ